MTENKKLIIAYVAGLFIIIACAVYMWYETPPYLRTGILPVEPGRGGLPPARAPDHEYAAVPLCTPPAARVPLQAPDGATEGYTATLLQIDRAENDRVPVSSSVIGWNTQGVSASAWIDKRGVHDRYESIRCPNCGWIITRRLPEP